MQVEVVVFNAPTSDGLQTLTSPELGSLVPKAAYFCIVGASPIDLHNDAHGKLGHGATDGTRQWALGGRSQNGVGTTNCSRHATTTKCIEVMHDSSDTILGEAEFDAFVAGGVRIDWTTAPNEDYVCYVVLFAGDDVEARADMVALLGQDVENDITAPGFKPKAILSASNVEEEVIFTDDWRMSYGVAALNAAGTDYDQKCWGVRHQDGVGTSNTEQYVATDRITVQAATGDFYTVELANPDASGFSIFTRDGFEGVGPDDWYYLALNFDGECAVFDYDLPTSTGNDSVTGLGFTPQAVLLGNGTMTVRDSLVSSGSASVHANCAFTDDDSVTMSVADEDGQATSDVNCMATSNALHHHFSSTGEPQYEATLVSMDPDGFTLNFSAVDGTSRMAFGIAFGVDAQCQISWAEFECPDAENQCQVSWAEFECPDVDAECQISWAEMECPDPSAAAQISYAVLQVPDEECCFPPDPETNKKMQLAFAELEVPDVAPDAFCRIGWAEFYCPDVPPGGGDGQANVSWAEFKTPDVNPGGNDGAAHISWAQMNTPDANAVMVSSLELVVPDPRRRGRVSWARLEFASVEEDNRVEKFVLKDINRELFLEELAVYDIVPDRGFFLPGFDPLDPQPESEPPSSDPQRVWTPMTEFSRRQFGETVERGEMWLDYSFRLTEEDQFHLLLVCHLHDATQRTDEQIENDQFFEDITILADYNLRCDTLSDIERNDMLCRLLRFTMGRRVETPFRRVHNDPVNPLEENEFDEPFE